MTHTSGELFPPRSIKEERQHVCKTCGASFKERRILVRHEMVHTGETPYTCILCDYSCSQLGNLQRHTETKHPHTPAQKTAFGSKRTSQLLKVLNRKVELPPVTPAVTTVIKKEPQQAHECSKCGKTFGNKKAFKWHLRKQHGQKMYTCSLCRYEENYQ